MHHREMGRDTLSVFSAHSLLSVAVSFSKAEIIDSTEDFPAKHLLAVAVAVRRQKLVKKKERENELDGVRGWEEKARLGLGHRRTHLAQDVIDG